MRRATLTSLLIATGLALSGCANEGTDASGTSASDGAADGQVPAAVAEQLAEHDVDATDIRSVIEELDQAPQRRPLAVNASVRPGSVVFAADSGEVEVPVPGDEVYVSIAPYEKTTHECYFHALGGCQGELTDEPVHVTITTDDGDVLVDEDATTYANGFVGFWLPRDEQGTVAITKAGLSGEAAFDTGEDGATCITTLQLR